MTTTKLRTRKREAATKPASKWRNKYLAKRRCFGHDTQRWHEAGVEYWGAEIFPSRDAAETAATECCVQNAASDRGNALTYLGAFPIVGEL